MAKIRSIHPAILIDPDFAAVPIVGRLLFVYSWMIADDAGNLENSPLHLKMAVFPGDHAITTGKIAKLVEVLISGRFFVPYEVDGRQYLNIRSFAKYQRPDHPTAPRCPLFPGQPYTYHVRQGNTFVSKTVRGALSERKDNVLAGVELNLERKGEELDLEGKGGDRGGKDSAPSAPRLPEGRVPRLKDQGKNHGAEKKPPTDVADILRNNGNWRDSIDHLRAEITAGRLTPQGARNGLVAIGAQIADVFPLFPDEVAQ